MDSDLRVFETYGANKNIEPELLLDEIADIAEYAKNGKKPPRCRGYLIRVNGTGYVVNSGYISGLDVLKLAGLVPAESYTLRVKKAGQRPEKIELDEIVDLRCPGIEKFKALPKDQTEGS